MKNLINAVCYHMLPRFIREQLSVKNNVLTLVTTMQYVKTLTHYKNVMPCHVIRRIFLSAIDRNKYVWD